MFAFVAAIFGAVCWGIAPIFGKLGLGKVDPLLGLCARTLIATCFVLGWLTATRGFHRLQGIPLRSLVLIGIEAILATLVGDLAYFAALKWGGAATTSLVMATSPLITVICSALTLGERLNLVQFCGALLIAGGLVLVGSQPH